MAGTGAGEKGLACLLKKRGARGGVNHSWTDSAPLPSFGFTVSTNAYPSLDHSHKAKVQTAHASVQSMQPKACY